MNTELSDNFILLPQDEWLKKHCEILRDSMALDGTALPKRLVQQVVHSIQSRNQIPIQEIEMQYLTEHIHTRLPKLGLPDHPAAARKAESRSTDALQEQVNYYINQVDGGDPRYNTEPSLSSSRAVSFDNLEDIEKFLLASDHDFGQAERMELDEEEDNSNSGAAESEAPQQGGIETAPTSVSGDSLDQTLGQRAAERGESAKKAQKIFGCGYCSKTFSKRFELTRHWVQLVNTCTEKLIPFSSLVPGTYCEKCGYKTFNAGGKLEDRAEHENDFDAIVHTDNLPKNWRRKYPKLADQDDDDISAHNLGTRLPRPYLFVGKYRNSETEDWKIMHVQFRDHPNRPKSKYSESVASTPPDNA